MATFKHFDLKLLNPRFDSPLLDAITELEHLRRLQLGGTTPSEIFFQLKQIFHKLESLGSARIEGNHTTLADYVEKMVDGDQAQESDPMREISNIDNAMLFVDEAIHAGQPLSEHFIRELHSLTVTNLQREGDRTPGAYRTANVQIAMSDHLPPDAFRVAAYMEELVSFVNQDHPPKYDLIKVALAHHRFGWIHPFSNGNGRVVRLMTYALLIKYGFNVKTGGRVLNPTAVFCNDREQYYRMLGDADKGTELGLTAWCTYVLSGILAELNKVDRLTDYVYLKEKILLPALSFSRDRGLIAPDEQSILLAVVSRGVAKSGDLAHRMPDLNAAQRTYKLKKLLDNKMLRPISPNSRQYTMCFTNNYLLRGVIKALAKEGFISASLQGEPLAT